MAALGVWVVSAAVLVTALVGRLALINQIVDGSPVSEDDARASDAFVAGANIAHVVVYIAAVIVFLVRLRRVVSNNFALGADVDTSTGEEGNRGRAPTATVGVMPEPRQRPSSGWPLSHSMTCSLGQQSRHRSTLRR